MKKILIVLFFTCTFLHAQRPNIIWERSLGGSYRDVGVSICKKSNGEYLILSQAESADGDVNSHLSIPGGDPDFWLCTMDSLGNLLSERSYGGTSAESPYEIIPVRSGGFIMCGHTGSDDIDVSGNHSWSTDVWLAKLDDSLNIEWQKCLGSTLLEYGFHVSEAADSGFFFEGNTYGNDGDVMGNHGSSDYWFGKTDSRGNLLWQMCLGTTSFEGAGCILATADGGVLFTGGTSTGAGTTCSSSTSSDNLWLVKVDGLGNIEWEKCLGGPSTDRGINLISDGGTGFYVAGRTNGNGNDVSGYFGNGDFWILHVDSTGNIIWQNCFGGSNGSEWPYALALTPDFGLVVCGSGRSNVGQAIGNHGWTDAFIVKMDSMGNYLWSGCYGGTSSDYAYDILIDDDGSIIFIGETSSNNGDVGSIHVAPDCWVVKLAAEPLGVSDLNNPITQLSANISGGKCTVTYSSKQYGDFYLRMFDLLGKEI